MADSGEKSSMPAGRPQKLCQCTPLLLSRALDTALVLGLHILQGSTINFFLITHKHKNSTYFWFLADFCVVLTCMAALLTSYNHVRIKNRRKIQPLHMIGPKQHLISRLGVLPSTYVAWFIYAIVLVAKVTVLHRSGIVANLQQDGSLSPQMLKTILCISIIIFYVQVNCYHNAAPGSLRQAALTGTCIAVALELLDSVHFLGLLLGDTYVLPETMDGAILTLASVNYLLPTVILFRLGLSDFEERPSSPILSLAHLTFKTFVVDVPFLCIRLFLWSRCSFVDVSPFIIKNFFYIIAWFRYSLPETVALCKQLRIKRSKEVSAAESAITTVTEVNTVTGSRTSEL